MEKSSSGRAPSVAVEADEQILNSTRVCVVALFNGTHQTKFTNACGVRVHKETDTTLDRIGVRPARDGKVLREDRGRPEGQRSGGVLLQPSESGQPHRAREPGSERVGGARRDSSTNSREFDEIKRYVQSLAGPSAKGQLQTSTDRTPPVSSGLHIVTASHGAGDRFTDVRQLLLGVSSGRSDG